MSSCSQCSHEIPAGSRFCPNCATAVDASAAATRTSIPHDRQRATPSSYPSLDNARFLPGSMVADRYRIVGLLGRGGMGEVYRADDLKLGQPVALKFLPTAVEGNPDRLRRFLNEVRMALRITHANVCRVHDIGEVDGHHYISMEYVDGEDLASLLRRIGRLPQDRGVAIARQLCAGLAAAHEQGILHRDLKPANIMIDGRGRARITDFGLADLAGTVDESEIRAGTPTYMAPEQLAGKGVSQSSDIYALGLVLYEIFTGKPVFKATSMAEMARLQQSGTPTEPSTLVSGLDPAIERAILRALDTDPARRPASALALAAALPGGDPLAAALAAGETPSPEMVADAGEAGGMAPGWVAACLIVIVAGVLLSVWMVPWTSGLARLERPLSLVALNERARLMVERLGHEEAPVDSAYGLGTDDDLAEWLEDERVEEIPQWLERSRPAPIIFWYRQAMSSLSPVDRFSRGPTRNDPPLTRPGMVSVWLDPEARLVRYQATPPATLADPVQGVGWDVLFAEAGLDMDSFSPVAPRHTPSQFADSLAAWEGFYPEAPDVALRIEAAALHGRPVSFRVYGPWSETGGEAGARESRQRWSGFILAVVVVLLFTSLFIMGRRSMRQGRSDLRGAFRFSTTIFILAVVASLIANKHFSTPSNWIQRNVLMQGISLLIVAMVFMAYIGLEPYVRRLWPEVLIAWSRLLAGRFRDPLVGRNILIGATAGICMNLLGGIHTLVPGLLGLPPEPLFLSVPEVISSVRDSIGEVLWVMVRSTGNPMFFLVSVVLLRMLVRRTWLAMALLMAIIGTIGSLGSPHPILDAALWITFLGVFFAVMMRIGLLAAIAQMWFMQGALLIRSLNPSTWEGPMSLMMGTVMLVVVVYAAWIALGGHSLLGTEESVPAPLGAPGG